jgi:hypothetical protein
MQAKMLPEEEPRRVAVNIAKLPELLGKASRIERRLKTEAAIPDFGTSQLQPEGLLLSGRW